MNCHELEPLRGPYLDSELDAKITLEIQQHLAACPDCARRFLHEEQLQARIKAALKEGPRTAALWEVIERSVAAAGPAVARPGLSAQDSQPAGWCALLSTLAGQLQVPWRPAAAAWAGLAAVWLVILALNLSARERSEPLVAGTRVPTAAEVRFAREQQQHLMADLAALSEPTAATKPKPAPPSPRSDCRNQTLNT